MKQLKSKLAHLEEYVVDISQQEQDTRVWYKLLTIHTKLKQASAILAEK